MGAIVLGYLRDFRANIEVKCDGFFGILCYLYSVGDQLLGALQFLVINENLILA